MPRPPKLRIKLTSESLNELLQESYRELAEQRNISLRQYNKQLLLLNKRPDPLLSKTNADLLKIIDSTIEKKISIARLLKDIVFSDSSSTRDSDGGNSLTSEERQAVFKAVNEEGSPVLRDKLEKYNVELDFGNLSDNPDLEKNEQHNLG